MGGHGRAGQRHRGGDFLDGLNLASTDDLFAFRVGIVNRLFVDDVLCFATFYGHNELAFVRRMRAAVLIEPLVDIVIVLLAIDAAVHVFQVARIIHDGPELFIGQANLEQRIRKDLFAGCDVINSHRIAPIALIDQRLIRVVAIGEHRAVRRILRRLHAAIITHVLIAVFTVEIVAVCELVVFGLALLVQDVAQHKRGDRATRGFVAALIVNFVHGFRRRRQAATNILDHLESRFVYFERATKILLELAGGLLGKVAGRVFGVVKVKLANSVHNLVSHVSRAVGQSDGRRFGFALGFLVVEFPHGANCIGGYVHSLFTQGACSIL
ncbi:hypothetical protein D9M72_428660 [compost metagenome]